MLVFLTRFRLFSLSILIVSCQHVPKNVKQVLELAGDNRKELEAVIDHYKVIDDKEKLEAAYFLIGNMSSQYHKPNSQAQLEFIDYLHKDVVNSNYDLPPFEMYEWVHGRDIHIDEWAWRKKIKAKWDSIKIQFSNSRNPEVVMDAKMISNELLIENIDEAFIAWKNSSWGNEIDFKKFCRSILPYRNIHDIPSRRRKELVNSISKYRKPTILETAIALNKAMETNFAYSETFEEFSHMRIEDVFKTKTFTCRQHSSAKLAALRAMGIPSNQVFAIDGTSWVRFENEEGDIYDFQDETISIRNSDGAVDERRSERYSKVYMNAYDFQENAFDGIPIENIPPLFYGNILDVTKDHLTTADISMNIKYKSPEDNSLIYLCVFHSKKLSWTATDIGVVRDKSVEFRNIGREKIYYPAYYIKGFYYPAADPFYLDKNGKSKFFSANGNNMEKVLLKRKCDWSPREYRFIRMSKGIWFEGANNLEFNNPERIASIVNEPAGFEQIPVEQSQDYRYYRLITLDTIKPVFRDQSSGIHLAELSFIDENGHKIIGKPISINKEKEELAKNLYDNDIRTNFDIFNKPGYVGLDAGRSIRVSKIKYLIKNSFNTIEPGDTYELFYWDNQWKSLGTQNAKDDYLSYQVPRNCVLWLRNRTKGKQEMIFFMRNGKQIWG